MNNESTKWFPACQLTVTLTRPKSKNEEIDIWNFIQRIIMKTGMVVVDCKPVNKDALNVVFYNVMHDYCTFK
uniref:Uncharacterized protein n=1 Tax=Caenorhabditis japonica TaxID=281687 RepID=A0A8R1HX60_CAEJA